MCTRTLFFTGVLLCLWGPGISQANNGGCDPWAAKIVSVQGQVEARRTRAENWQAVSLGEIYCPGDSIRVGQNSRAGLVLANETLVRLDQQSAITLTDVDPQAPSLIEILKGIAHFISRVPRSLKVNTPFVNAAIEGTEFVVEVDQNEARVTVFEGVVLAQNEQGELRLTSNESIVAERGAGPRKRLLVHPRDAVQWALYYPPLFEQAAGRRGEASQLLQRGRVSEARALLAGETGAEAQALLAIIAVVQNKKDKALQLAQEAVRAQSNSVAAHIALSYAQQAHFDLHAALGSAHTATALQPNNALAWARLAELQLSLGYLEQALKSAQQATQLNPSLSRTQTILGYAHLTRIEIDKATSVFQKAIRLDQADPLPRLGLGLAKIRNGKLTEGRREIEIAASLDPSDAIIRSYLGKAYYEEKRSPLDAEQFAMAKELDPRDPTPYYYDAIRKQSENDPVGALQDLNKSVELNDNRAVYRSSLQLDQDLAARSVNLASVYQDLGFDFQALAHAYNALNQDYMNHSAHRFLSDAYKTVPRHEIARVSESLQAKLLQPINTAPNLISSNDTRINVKDNGVSAKPALNEYGSLLTQNGDNVFANLVAGSNKTISDEVAAYGIHGPISYSVGQFHYSTDGYRPNNDLKYNIYNAFIQYAPSYQDHFQIEINSRNVNYGDIAQRIDPTDFSESNRRKTKIDTARLGYTHRIDPRSRFIASFLYNNEQDRLQLSDTISGVLTETDSKTNADGVLGELQYQENTPRYHYILGGGHFSDNQNTVTDVDSSIGGVPLPPPFSTTITTRENIHHTNGHLYITYNPSEQSSILIGGSYDNHNSYGIDEEQFNPKFGFSYSPIDNLFLRAAYYEVLRRSLFRAQTIEPTQVVGFNQFFDEGRATMSENRGLGFDYKGNDISFGAQALIRDLVAPRPTLDPDTRKEEILNTYFYWILNPRLTISIEYVVDYFKSDLVPPTTTEVARLRTDSIPISLFLRVTPNFDLRLLNTHVTQEVDIDGTITESDFSIVDLIFTYSLPQNVELSLVAKNVFDKDFAFQDRNFLLSENHAPLYIPENTYYANLSVRF